MEYMKPYITNWGNELKEGSAERHRLRNLDKAAEAAKLLNTERLRVKPLAVQLSEFLNGLPPAVRNRAWPISALLPHLSGVYRPRASAQLLGTTLKQLGWRRVRLYGNGWEGNRVWLPPCLSPSA